MTLKVSVSAENEPTFGARGHLTMQKWRASEDASTSAFSSGLDLSSVNLVHTDTEERNEPHPYWVPTMKAQTQGRVRREREEWPLPSHTSGPEERPRPLCRPPDRASRDDDCGRSVVKVEGTGAITGLGVDFPPPKVA